MANLYIGSSADNDRCVSDPPDVIFIGEGEHCYMLAIT